MIIYPAINVKDGRCVCFHHQDTIYHHDPGLQALTWAQAGFSWLHITDLDDTEDGQSRNRGAIESVIDAVDIPIQIGGNIRTLDHVKFWIEEGASRVVLDMAALEDVDLVMEACGLFHGQIVASMNIRDDFAVIEKLEDGGVAAIISDVESIPHLVQSTSMPVVVAGGVTSLTDLEKIASSGAGAVLVGKALYEKTILPQDALKLTSEAF